MGRPSSSLLLARAEALRIFLAAHAVDFFFLFFFSLSVRAGVLSPFASSSVEQCYRRCLGLLREGGLLSLLSSSELAQLCLVLSRLSKAISSTAQVLREVGRAHEVAEDENDEEEDSDRQNRLRGLQLGTDGPGVDDQSLEARANDNPAEDQGEEEHEEEKLERAVRRLFVTSLNVFSDRVRPRSLSLVLGAMGTCAGRQSAS